MHFTNRVISPEKHVLFPKFICQAIWSQHKGEWTRGIRPFYFKLFVAIYMWLFRKQIYKITQTWTLNLIRADQIFVYSCSLGLLFSSPPLYLPLTNLSLCYKDVGSEWSWPWSYHQVPDPALTQGELLQPCRRAGTVRWRQELHCRSHYNGLAVAVSWASLSCVWQQLTE